MKDLIDHILFNLKLDVEIVCIRPRVKLLRMEDLALPNEETTVPEEEKRETKKTFGGPRKNPNGNPPSLLTPEIVDNMKKVKRINWKTIAKIKQLKVEGYTSGEVAEDLGIDLGAVNKYWYKE